MVIDVINIQRVAFGEAENHAPIGPNRDRPKAFELAFERMQTEAGQIQVSGRSGGIKSHENITQLRSMFPDHAARVVVLVKTLQSFVTDRPDHVLS